MVAATKEHVLLVDDEPQILVALEDLLSDQFVVLTAPSAGAALELMRHSDDIAVVVTDQRMPDMAGDELVARLTDSYLAQKIMVTGYADLGAVVRAVNDGRIFAYVTKPWDEHDLRAKVTKAAAQFRLSQDLASEKRLLNDLMDNSPDQIYFKDRDLRFIRVNKSIATWLDREVDELVGRHLRDVATSVEEAEKIEAEERACLEDGRSVLDVVRQEQRGGSLRWLSERKAPILGVDRSAVGLVGISRDITQHRQLEQQLLQAQKMEAIGRLAGGVAHDFNNLLVVIQGYGELVQMQFNPGDACHESLGELLHATERAAALTKQLLTFSRKQSFRATLLNLNEVVEGVVSMLRRLIHENIRVELDPDQELGLVRGDVTQLEQVLLNLAINARDAMPEGGRLRISTGAHGDEQICLCVSDTGTGMSPEVVSRIFEPFFSTKEVGKGTGLGLSTVYGIVQQMRGTISVDSVQGEGTTFRILLPRAIGHEVATNVRRRRSAAKGGTETILLVEDDEAVRRVARHILEGSGYQVLEASSPSEGQLIWSQAAAQVDLLLTDIIMPEMDGPSLVRLLLKQRPDLRVLYMSGYAEQRPLDSDPSAQVVNYIEKPFSPLGLLAAVRDALDDAPSVHQ